jgi:hypothetical protein
MECPMTGMWSRFPCTEPPSSTTPIQSLHLFAKVSPLFRDDACCSLCMRSNGDARCRSRFVSTRPTWQHGAAYLHDARTSR